MMWVWSIHKFQMITVLIGRFTLYVFLKEGGEKKGAKGRVRTREGENKRKLRCN